MQLAYFVVIFTALWLLGISPITGSISVNQMQVSKAFANRFVEMTLTSGIWPQQSSIRVALCNNSFHYADWILYPRRGEKLKLMGNKIELKICINKLKSVLHYIFNKLQILLGLSKSLFSFVMFWSFIRLKPLRHFLYKKVFPL